MAISDLFSIFKASGADLSASVGAPKEKLPLGTIKIDSVSKSFRRKTAVKQGYSSVKSDLLKRVSLSRGASSAEADCSDEEVVAKGDELLALDNLSIDIAPGSALGIIGGNGSGKSTLLKLISGIYLPDTGSVQSSGRISALIELGAGFHPDFSGRENVFLGGVMYGLSKKEIEEKFDDIVRYAELEDFIDDPVRTYSSGMYMRLGFSLAIHTDPDILLIDEVLAVGDASFIHRCKDTISEFKRRGKTLVFVTHDLHSVNKWCDEVIWLNYGVVEARGKARKVVDAYLQAVEGKESADLNEENQIEGPQGDTQRWGNQDVEIYSVKMLDEKGNECWLFQPEDAASIEVSYRIQKPIPDLVFGVGIRRIDGVEIYGSNTELEDLELPFDPDTLDSYPAEGSFRFDIHRLGLTENSYYVDVAAHSSDGLPYDYHHLLHKFAIRSQVATVGICDFSHSWEFPSRVGEAAS
ncbi:UNVERIFIED_CONTAM: hypothetical protein GTU68_005859 [Idotea baltica]|nr:hypothetical protein [Idotea baltica]